MKKLLIVLTFMSLFIVGCSDKKQSESVGVEIEEEQVLYTNHQKEISKERVIESLDVDSSYTVNPNDPEALLESSEKISVVRARLGDIFMAEYINESGSIPQTPVDVVSYEVIDGDDVQDLDKLYYNGGIVNTKDYVERMPGDAKKAGMESSEDTYVQFTLDSTFDYEVGSEYVLIIRQLDSGDYAIVLDGYGTFYSEEVVSKQRSNQNSRKFKNVLNDQLMIIND